MIAVDATPLCYRPWRGVARMLLGVLRQWAEDPPPEGVLLLAPRALPPGVPALGGHVVPRRPLPVPRFRRRVGRLLAPWDASVLYVPWSAFPRLPLPVVATVHELPFVRLGAVEGRVRTSIHRRWLRRNVATCARVVVPSHATRDDLLVLHPEAASRIEVVSPPFDPEPWERAGRETPRSDVRTLIVVGTGFAAGGWRKKGMDVLVRALARVRLAEMRTVVVGHVPRHRARGLEIVRDPGEAELRRRVASAWTLVHPARSEGFGYPPLEAMAASTPVIASDGGALPETVSDAARLVPAGDDVRLAAAIEEVVEDRDVAAELVRRGRRRARAFPAAAAARQLLHVLRAAGEGRS